MYRKEKEKETNPHPQTTGLCQTGPMPRACLL